MAEDYADSGRERQLQKRRQQVVHRPRRSEEWRGRWVCSLLPARRERIAPITVAITDISGGAVDEGLPALPDCRLTRRARGRTLRIVGRRSAGCAFAADAPSVSVRHNMEVFRVHSSKSFLVGSFPLRTLRLTPSRSFCHDTAMHVVHDFRLIAPLRRDCSGGFEPVRRGNAELALFMSRTI